MQDAQSHKQAFLFTIINYVAILIGLFATLFLYPENYEFYGEMAYIDSLAQILFPIMVFGGAQALIHFYPELSHENKTKLFKFSLRTVFMIFLFLGVTSMLLGFVLEWDKKTYFYFALPLALFMAIVEVFKRQSANLNKIVVPTFYEKIIPKLVFPIGFFLFMWNMVQPNAVFVLINFGYLLLVLLQSQYLLKHFSISSSNGFSSLFTQIEKKEYYTYCWYSFLGSFGSFLAFRVDGLMIPAFLDFDANGAYRNAVNFAAAMAIPATGLFTVYAPQVSSYIKNNDFKTLQLKYIETAKLLFFIGAIILGCVWVGAESFFKILPTSEKLLPILPIIYILGTNVLFNMATGFNSEIISYSKYFRFNIIAVFILVGVNVVLNYYFLTQTDLGIKGVAMATFISLVFFNVSKLIFIYKKLSMLPFNMQYAKLVIVMVVIVFGVNLLPQFTNPLIDICLRCTLVIITSLVSVLLLKLLPALNYWLLALKLKFTSDK